MGIVFFTEKNWDKFFTANKKTTIRTHLLKEGIHDAMNNRFKRKILGKVKISKETKICKVCDLTEEDAKNDGFFTLNDLLLELGRLNKDMKSGRLMFIHPAEVVQNGQGTGEKASGR